MQPKLQNKKKMKYRFRFGQQNEIKHKEWKENFQILKFTLAILPYSVLILFIQRTKLEPIFHSSFYSSQL